MGERQTKWLAMSSALSLFASLVFVVSARQLKSLNTRPCVRVYNGRKDTGNVKYILLTLRLATTRR